MDKIEKLLRKISGKDREKLLVIIEKLLLGRVHGLHMIKLRNTDFYRIRSGRFRIIFHKEIKSGQVVVDSIRLRGKDTYKF